MFDDVDIVLYSHVSSAMTTAWGDARGNGMVSVEYTFEGESAHGAGDPWNGRSALDAVELMNIGWNFRREHLRIQQRSHYVISDGGDQPNVVPSTASVWYFFRESDYENIMRMWRIGDAMAEGAAKMTDTTVTSRVLGAAWPQHHNRVIAETMFTAIQRVGMPDWSEDDQRFARAVQKMLGVEEQGLLTEAQEALDGAERIPDNERRGGGSDDIGDISWVVPTATLRFPVQHPRRRGPQLEQEHRHGHADRPQGGDRRGQGPGADAARLRAPAGAGAAGAGLFREPDDGTGSTRRSCDRRTSRRSG